MVDTSGTGKFAEGLIAQAKAILLKPAEEWPKIAASPATPGDIFVRYAVPLAAIGPIAQFIGGQVFGYGAFGFHYRPGFISGLGSAIIGYVMSLVGLVVLTLIADWLAPKFQGTSNRTMAFKLVAYSATAGWIAGIFGLIPSLSWLGLLGLYSFYLFYTGAAPLMRVPQEKLVGYTIVTVIVTVIVYLVAGLVVGALGGLMFGHSLPSFAGASDEGKISGSVSVPGVGKVDLGKIQQATDQMEARTKDGAKAVDATALEALLPTSIGRFQRTAIDTGTYGQFGSGAQGTYASGDQNFTLQVTDLNAVGALAGIGAALGVASSHEDANGYDRTSSVDGQMQTEKWDKTNNSGTFGVTVDSRFMIQADGTVGSIDQLKEAVATIDKGKLESLAS